MNDSPKDTRYIILTSSARVPGAARSHDLQRVALVELEPGHTGKRPAAISARAPGVRRIVREWSGGGLQPVVAAEALKAKLEAGAAVRH